jgi:hypothetical protein
LDRLLRGLPASNEELIDRIMTASSTEETPAVTITAPK